MRRDLLRGRGRYPTAADQTPRCPTSGITLPAWTKATRSRSGCWRAAPPVWSSDDQEVGTVDSVLATDREDIFDGIVIRTKDGRRFVDAPEVARIAERRVTLIDHLRRGRAAARAQRAAPRVQGEPGRRAGWRASSGAAGGGARARSALPGQLIRIRRSPLRSTTSRRRENAPRTSARPCSWAAQHRAGGVRVEMGRPSALVGAATRAGAGRARHLGREDLAQEAGGGVSVESKIGSSIAHASCRGRNVRS